MYQMWLISRCSVMKTCCILKKTQLCCAVKCSFINGRFPTGLLALSLLYLPHVVSCLEKRTRIRTCLRTWPTPKPRVSVRHDEALCYEHGPADLVSLGEQGTPKRRLLRAWPQRRMETSNESTPKTGPAPSDTTPSNSSTRYRRLWLCF